MRSRTYSDFKLASWFTCSSKTVKNILLQTAMTMAGVAFFVMPGVVQPLYHTESFDGASQGEVDAGKAAPYSQEDKANFHAEISKMLGDKKCYFMSADDLKEIQVKYKEMKAETAAQVSEMKTTARQERDKIYATHGKGEEGQAVYKKI